MQLHVPDTDLGTGDLAVDKTSPSFLGAYIPVGGDREYNLVIRISAMRTIKAEKERSKRLQGAEQLLLDRMVRDGLPNRWGAHWWCRVLRQCEGLRISVGPRTGLGILHFLTLRCTF